MYVPGVLPEGVMLPSAAIDIPEGVPVTQVEAPVPPAPVIVGATGDDCEVQSTKG